MIALVLTLTASVFAVAAVAYPTAADASHFRSTQLTWEVVDVNEDGSVEVEFTSTVSARAGFYAGSPSVGDTLSPVSSFAMGDGTNVGGMDHEVIFLDETNDWVLMETSFRHVYAERGQYTASWQQCCRLQAHNGHINNSNLQNRIETYLDLSGGENDPLPATSSPVSLTSPIVDCPMQATCAFTVPAVDAQGFDLRWRFAQGSEATSPGQAGNWQEPGAPWADNDAQLSASNGRYTWDTNGADLAVGDVPTYYSTQVVIEKRAGGEVVATTAVDFFIRLGGDGENRPPRFIDPTPADGSAFRIALGGEIAFDVVAEDPDADDTVTLAVLGSPAGAGFDTTPGNPASGTFSWEPSSVGSRLVALLAQDDLGLGAVPHSVTLIASHVVSLALAPGSATATVGDTHVVTATATDAGDNPLAQAEVHFEVVDGPHAGSTGTATTDAAGEATFAIDGTEVGIDTVVATHTTSEGEEVTSAEVTVDWSEVLDEVDETDADAGADVGAGDEAGDEADDDEADDAEASEEPIEVLDEAVSAEPVAAEPTYTG